MSLDVYLNLPGERVQRRGSGIFIRENGATREISREEWDERNPGHEPCVVDMGPETTDVVFNRNITHNLGEMADACGVYKACWRPEEIGATKASDIEPLLRMGLASLLGEPQRYKALNPPNGWGSYEALCDFVGEYMRACEKYPDAIIRVSR